MYLEQKWLEVVSRQPYKVNVIKKTPYLYGVFFSTSMQKYLFYIIPFIFLLPSSIQSETIIKEIKIYGNQITKDYVIKRELEHTTNSIYDSLKTIDDRNRIYNLDIFSSVDVTFVDSTYSIYVREAPRILPLPLFSYDEEKGIGYGAGIQNTNLFGRNYKLFFGGMTGATNIYVIRFLNPWAFGNHVSLAFEMYRDKFKNEIHKYITTTNGIELESGFYIGLNNKFKVRAGFNGLLLEEMQEDITTSNYNYLISLIDYQFDTRDIYNDPTKGSLFWLTNELAYELGDSKNSYSDLTLSYEKFYKIHNYRSIVFSYKILSSIYFSKINHIYNIKYLGGDRYIKGYSIDPSLNYLQDYKFSGYNILLSSIAIQGTIIEKKDYNGIELGLDGVVFADCGVISDTLKNIHIDNAVLGFGGGIKIFVSSVGYLGIYIGFNPGSQSFVHLLDSND